VDAEVRLRVKPGQSQLYNNPTSDKIAVILPEDKDPTDCWDIVLHYCSPSVKDVKDLMHIDDGSAAYAPLHYILLFPYGTNGWYCELLHCKPPPLPDDPKRVIDPNDSDFSEAPPSNKKVKRITQTEYAAFHLHTCQSEYSVIHLAGRLFQQYIVDMWASAEQSCLTYLHLHQPQLHALLYNRIEDMLFSNNVADPHALGKRTVLPSSYTSGLRSMKQWSQDALVMACCQGL
jgi:hypothetical protein